LKRKQKIYRRKEEIMMMIFKTIDGLFKGMKIGVLALAVAGIFGSVGLLFMNISLGLASTSVFLATLIGSASLVLILAPEGLLKRFIKKDNIVNKRYFISSVVLVIAFAIVGFVYFNVGGFPALNIPFLN